MVPSSSGPPTRLSQQGQRPKTEEATYYTPCCVGQVDMKAAKKKNKFGYCNLSYFVTKF
jgi:hypothetical protein